MGFTRHHAIVVTGTYGGHIHRAREKAIRLACRHFEYTPEECLVSPVLGPTINGTETFVVGPDGSNEGWDTSINGDNFRDDFIKWLKEQCYEDGSSPLRWVEVQYGDDDWETKVVRDSDEDRRKVEEERIIRRICRRRAT